jgi:hypothetical protein
LNDHEVALAEASSRVDVATWLRAGVNGLEIAYGAADPSVEPRRTTISLATFAKEGNRNVIGDTIVEAVVPTGPAASDCTDTFRFWLGPPPAAPAGLSRGYWLFVNGPPIGYRVEVLVRDTPVRTVASGEVLMELTPWLAAGKNEIRYHAEPTCAGEAVPDPSPLEFTLVPGRMGPEGFEAEGPALGTDAIAAPRQPAAFERVRTLRAR